MASEIKSHNMPKKNFIAAVASLGFSAVQSYYSPTLFKSDAPISTLYDIMKIWKKNLFDTEVEKGDYLKKNVIPGSAADRIL